MLKPAHHTLRQISVTLTAGAFGAGLLLTLGLLSADSAGRVNLLYLLMLFTFLPVASLLLSLAFGFRDAGRGGFSALLLDLPLWPRQWQREILVLAQTPALKSWFFYQSQIVALGFGVGGLLALLLLLLGSDVSFVWRSTLLEARQILPVLTALAWPWWFWDSAQPSLELLQQTQEFRLAPQPGDTALVFGQWWQYVLAAQCTYNLLPRSLLLLAARWRYRRQLASAQVPASVPSPAPSVRRNTVPAEGRPAELTHSVQPPYVLIDWAGAPAFCRAYLTRQFGAPQRVIEAGPATSGREPATSTAQRDNPVVLVKSWEPPMGELKDYLEEYPGGGLVVPLDWDSASVQPVKAAHLKEWLRFCGTLDGWRVLQAGEKS